MAFITVRNALDQPLILDAAGHVVGGGAYGTADAAFHLVTLELTRKALLEVTDPGGDLSGLPTAVRLAIEATRTANGEGTPPAAAPSPIVLRSFAGAWRQDTVYEQGVIVTHQNALQAAEDTHISGATFDQSHWRPIDGRAAIYDAYAAKGTGPLGTADSGHAWALVSSVGGVKQAAGDPSGLSIVAGAVTNTITAASPAAGYATVDAGAPITRLAADVAFSASTTAGGSAALVPFAEDISTTFPAIPDTDCHVTVSPAGWTWAIFRGNVFTELANGSWRPDFAWTAGVFEHVEITFGDGVGYLTGPDGVTYTVEDARIGQTDMRFPAFETFQGTAASTDARASFRNVAFGTQPVSIDQPGPTYLEIDRRLAGAQKLVVPQSAALSYGPGVAAEYPMPAAEAVVDAVNLSLPFVVPASGNIEVTLDGWIQWLATPANFFWLIYVPESDTFYNPTQMAADANVTNKRYHVTIPILGIGASFLGTTIHLQWAHFALTAGCGELFALGGPGQPAVMKATALA